MPPAKGRGAQVALPTAPPRVALGTWVEIDLVGDGGTVERMTVDIVPDAQADFANGFLGVGTPLAQAIVGQRAGARIAYAIADVVEVHIRSVRRSERAPAADVAAARDAATQEAVSRANMEDAVRLALTVDVKWGDYDPEAVESGWDQKP